MASQTATRAPEIEAIAERIPETPPNVRGSREEIAEAVAAIAREFDPDQIVLFGSRAYGEPTFDSDVDLLVIADTPLTTREQRLLMQKAARSAARFSPEIHARTPKQIAVGLAEGDFFIEDVMLKGITLYRRSGTRMTDQTASTNGTDEEDQGARIKQATQGWINKAESDLRAARVLLNLPDPLLEPVCFHAQQCAEKYLKALLQEINVRFKRTHELDELAQLAVQAVFGIAFQSSDLEWLSGYAVDVRYPDREPPIVASQADAERAVQIAEDVRSTVRKTLGLENGASGNGTGQSA